jgi:LacI family transcriptional regulator
VAVEKDQAGAHEERARRWLAEVAGTKKPTINDVAQLSNVSKKTISRIINDSPLVKERTRREVHDIIRIIGYEPDPLARGLAFRHSFLVGMIYDNPNPQYVVNMQQGILDGLKGSGYELLVHPCERDSERFIQDARMFVERQKLYGVILTPSVSEDERIATILREIGCGYVRIASVKLDEDKHMLVSNDRLGGVAAARHLAELGHRRLACISGRPGFRSSIERRHGFEAGLAESGIQLDPRYIMEGDYTFGSGVDCGNKLLQMDPRPTGIFAANDEMAAGLLQAARIAGVRVPEELSVVGYDDFQIASSVWPRLTTIHSPTRDIGRKATHRLLAPGKEADLSIGTIPWIVERESSAPPPQR